LILLSDLERQILKFKLFLNPYTISDIVLMSQYEYGIFLYYPSYSQNLNLPRIWSLLLKELLFLILLKEYIYIPL
jgi:hypothetical protein